ncbi:hypothetical protein WG66_005138 [Moniliophthora roreri]|nr:hypothetical protein WG66_005138 [Moniliophthora roreri]
MSPYVTPPRYQHLAPSNTETPTHFYTVHPSGWDHSQIPGLSPTSPSPSSDTAWEQMLGNLSPETPQDAHRDAYVGVAIEQFSQSSQHFNLGDAGNISAPMLEDSADSECIHSSTLHLSGTLPEQLATSQSTPSSIVNGLSASGFYIGYPSSRQSDWQTSKPSPTTAAPDPQSDTQPGGLSPEAWQHAPGDMDEARSGSGIAIHQSSGLAASYPPDVSSVMPQATRIGKVATVAVEENATKRRKHRAEYKCQRCSQTFTARHNLQNHLNSHDGIKKYACQVCKRPFTVKSDVKRHEDTMHPESSLSSHRRTSRRTPGPL